MESQASEAVRSDTTRTGDALQSRDISSSIPRAAESTDDSSSSVTKKLEEELKKRDALIEVLLFLTLDHILIVAEPLILSLVHLSEENDVFRRGCMKKTKSCLTD